MLYLTIEVPTKKRGRPRVYDGKIDFKNLDLTRCDKVDLQDEDAYTLIVYSKALKRKIRLAIVFTNEQHTKWILYFSTDTLMSGIDIIEYYRTRFQIEFNFRDAKQFTGLNHCQARGIKKLDFNFNASLAVVNIAKDICKQNNIKFSIYSCNVLIHNAFMIE